MFNLTGSEIIVILLIGLVVLGPEKLPGAIRRAMRTYQELRKMGDGFQSEFRAVVDEPMRELRETAGLISDQADPKKQAEAAEQEAERAAKAEKAEKAAAQERRRRDVVADMERRGPDPEGPDVTMRNGAAPLKLNGVSTSADDTADDTADDPWADPVDEPVAAPAAWAAPTGTSGSLAPPSASASAPAPPGLPADPTDGEPR